MFDIKNQSFTKRPEDFEFNPNLYMKQFQKQVDKIDIHKGELKRDIIDYDELMELKQGKEGDDNQLRQHLDGMIRKLDESLEFIENNGVNGR